MPKLPSPCDGAARRSQGKENEINETEPEEDGDGTAHLSQALDEIQLNTEDATGKHAPNAPPDLARSSITHRHNEQCHGRATGEDKEG